LRDALEALIAAYRRIQPEMSVVPTYGSSGNFYTQISNDAPFDLFLSADVAYPQKLIEQGKGVKETLFRYGVGRIVVWVPNDSKLDIEARGLGALTDPSVHKIAIANPAHAPYGRAAEAAMRSAGVYEQVKGRLVLGENVMQAAQFVQSGSADVGVVAQSLSLSSTMRSQGRSWLVPADAHPRIEQAGVILTSAKEPAAARDFIAFLAGAEGKAILAQYGFAPVPE
jgi:molybdate transport system substrate-binding protein